MKALQKLKFLESSTATKYNWFGKFIQNSINWKYILLLYQTFETIENRRFTLEIRRRAICGKIVQSIGVRTCHNWFARLQRYMAEQMIDLRSRQGLPSGPTIILYNIRTIQLPSLIGHLRDNEQPTGVPTYEFAYVKFEVELIYEIL